MFDLRVMKVMVHFMTWFGVGGSTDAGGHRRVGGMDEFEMVDVVVTLLVMMNVWVEFEDAGCCEACVQSVWRAGCCVLCGKCGELTLLGWNMLCWVV